MAYCDITDVQALLPEMVLVTAFEGEYHVLSLADLYGGIVLAGTNPNGKVVRSTDYGVTWKSMGRLGVAESVLSLAYLESVALAGTSPGGKIYRSVDNGLTWTDVGQLGVEESVNALVSFGENISLAGTSPGGKIFRSVDAGLTWTDIGQMSVETSIYSLAYLGNGIVIAGTGPGGKIFRSTDNGLSWVDKGQLGTETEVLSLFLAQAGTSPGGKIFTSADDGLTWVDGGQVGEAKKVLSIGSASPGNDVVGTYSEKGGSVYQNGATGSWRKVELVGENRINTIIYAPRETEDYQTTGPEATEYTVLVGTGATAKIFRLIPLRSAAGTFYNLRGIRQDSPLFSSAEVEAFITGADAEINGYCQKRYASQIPFDPVPKVVRWISERLAAAEIWMMLRRNEPEAAYEELYEKQLYLRETAVEKLREIADGEWDIYEMGMDVSYGMPLIGENKTESVFDDMLVAAREA